MRSRLFVLLAVVLASSAIACGESLTTSNTCPMLCPSQDVAVRDTIINPVLVFDSTFVGFPDRGNELGMLLTTRGDTVETRGVVRYDSLTYYYPVVNDTARPIAYVDSARLKLVVDTTYPRLLPASVRFELYDVDDSTASDTSSAALNAKFIRSRLIGQITLSKDSVGDTVRVPLADSAVLAKIAAKGRLRIGIRADGSGPVALVLKTIESGITPVLSYRGTKDSSIAKLVVTPYSSSPLAEPDIQAELLDFQVIAKYKMPAVPTGTMSIGGLPGRRAYLRFDLPRRITDSTTIVRATLRLTQQRVAFGGGYDTVTIHAHPVLASGQVTDLRRASTLLAAAGTGIYDSLLVSPRDSGQRTIEMYGLVRLWGSQAVLINSVPRSIVLRAGRESLASSEIRFFGSTAPLALRPSMRISYIPRVTFGVP